MTSETSGTVGKSPAGVAAHASPSGTDELLRRPNGRIRTKDPKTDRELRIFLIAFIAVGLICLFLMHLDWPKFFVGLLSIPNTVGKLMHPDFSQTDVTFSALLESISVAILSTIYSGIGGAVLGIFLAKNLTPSLWVARVLSAAITFLRAIPSIIWVLLVLVCVGFGPTAGIVGICIFSTSFFGRAFAECFEEVSEDTLEAMKAMGANRIKVFFSAVLPSALTRMIAWSSISFENNFESSAVLGTVGAGGIGYVISNCMTRYAYGQATVAIVMSLIFTYIMEIALTFVKEKNIKLN